jgi:hypothetical protein
MMEAAVIRHDKKRKGRENICPARFFSSRGVPAPSTLRRIGLKLNAPTCDQLPLQNVFPSSQVAAPLAARLVAVHKAAFDQLTPPPRRRSKLLPGFAFLMKSSRTLKKVAHILKRFCIA